MPEGPAGFPRLTELGPLVDSIEPQINLESGEYPISRLREEQPKTAEDTERFLKEIFQVDRPNEAIFNYGKYSIDKIVIDDGFIPTLSKYVGVTPDDAMPMNKDDLSSLDGSFPHHANREEAEIKARNDIKRLNNIHDDIERDMLYWPPTFEIGGSTLDGAHRVASLYHFTGLRNKIYAWELANPEEIGVE